MREQPALRVAAYRLRSTARQRLGGYLALVVIVGLLGGLSLAAIAGARRTQSAFPRFLKVSNASDISVDNGPYSPDVIKQLGHMADVKTVRPYVAFSFLKLEPTGYPLLNSGFNNNVESVGSLNGLYFTQDRVAVLAGRRANVHRANEAMVSEQTASSYGIKLGDVLPIGVYSGEQTSDPNFDPLRAHPYRTVRLRVVGIAEFADEVVQDDIDRIPRLLLTPSLTQQLLGCCATYAWIGVQLRNGATGVQTFERAYEVHNPQGAPVFVRVNSVVEAQGERAVKPLSIALGVFGIIIALAALVLGAQAIGRHINLSSQEHAIMRALGATPNMLVLAELVGLALAILIGSLAAVAVAIALSPIAPIGVMHRIEVAPGVDFDWTVLLLGFGGFALLLGAVAAGGAYRQAPHRVARRQAAKGYRASRLGRTAVSGALPVGAVTGIGLAMNATRDSKAVPVRSTIIGAALALITLVSAITFGASLNNLVNQPNLYGWNWTGAILASGGYGDVPGSESARLLDADHAVSAWNGIYLSSLLIDGTLVPAAGAFKVHARLNPPILSGHTITNRHEILLGGATLADLHKHVGDAVTVSTPNGKQTLRIVGAATMPVLGVGHGLHMSMGSGAWASSSLFSAAAQNITGNSLPGPNVVLVRYRNNVVASDSSKDLARLAGILAAYNPLHVNPAQLASFSTLSVQHPAEIVNYRTMGAAPIILGISLALGASMALAATLFASIRRRRRDLALLKSLGFTRRQLRATVMWQSSVIVVLGALTGVPLGIALGRVLWNAFAGELHVLARPIVPPIWVAIIAVGAVVLGIAVAALPGRAAGRIPAATLLRDE